MRRPALSTVLLLGTPLVLLAALVLFAAWLLGQASGSAWLLRQIPGLVVEAPQGALIGDFSARTVVYTLSGPQGQVRISGLRWHALRLAWRQIAVARLEADAVELQLPSSNAATPAPTSLALPLTVEIDTLRVGRLQQGSLTLHELDAGLLLGAEQHRLTLRSLGWEQLRLSGQASVGTMGTLPVQLALEVQGKEADWRGHLRAQGPLALLDAQARLEEAGQQLQIAARLQPFAVWPIQSLQADAKALDLHALMQALPRSALTGTAVLQSSGWQAPAQLQLQMSNAAVGRWDEQRLPVQSLSLALQARPDQPQSLQLHALDLRLPAGGRIQGQGRMDPGERWHLQLRLQNLRPETLDRRAAPLLLNGTAELAGAPGEALALTTHLSGAQASLDLQASIGAERVDIRRAELLAGGASLQLQGTATLAGGAWRAQASGQVHDFNPRFFWAAAPQAALSAQLKLDLRPAPDSRDWPRGEALVQLLPSNWAGLPLQGQARYADGELHADLAAAQAHLTLNAHVKGKPAAPAADGEARLDAPDLAVLDPLLGGEHLAGSGKAQFQFSADPLQRFKLDGQASLQELRLSGPVQAQAGQAQLKLRAGSDMDAPLAIDAQLSQVNWAGQNLQQAHLALNGSWARHSLQLDLQGQLHPPQAHRARALEGEAHLALDGALSKGAWSARIARLQARPADARLPAWMDASDLQLSLQLNPDWVLTDARLAPGQIELGGARWHWSDLQWHAPRRAGSPPEIKAALELDPLSLAPLLARWQPGFGWSGDLVVGGTLHLQSGEGTELEALLERKGGDLIVVDEAGHKRVLGLNQMRLGLSAHAGRWLFTPDLAGTGWGRLSGSVSASTTASALWPAGSAELGGRLQAQVAELGTWGALLPAGWRLGGGLSAQVDLGGTLAAPHLKGLVQGQGITLRNLLQGVDWADGAIQLELDGASAQLKQFSLRGGSGHLEARGQASLGEQPRAEVQIKAEHFGVLSRIDRRLVASGEAELKLDAQTLALNGKLQVDEGAFDFSHADAPALGEDVYVLRADSPGLPPPPEPSARKTQVDIALDLGEKLSLRGRGFESGLRGALHISQQAGKPTVKGAVHTEGGSYAAYGQKLDIERGELSFNGPYDNPRLDILALRANSDTRVGVLVSGTAQSPQVALYSDPDMSDTDKLAWLLLGHGSDSLGSADTALLQNAAMALLAGNGQSSSDKLIKTLGLDEVSVRQGEASADSSTRDTIVHLGKQISKRWYVGYERSINATTGSWQLVYRIAQRFTLRAQTGDDNALELIWQWKWQ
jgi:translocation and assembly module TamB